MSQRLVIVGNGMATQRLLEQLLARDHRYQHIDVISAEPQAGYNRILLSPWLAGDKQTSQLVSHPLAWYRQHQINLHRDTHIGRIDRHHSVVVSSDGRRFHYDTLILATGSRARSLGISGAELDGVLALRSWTDAEKITQRIRPAQRAVVIGGGLLGLETAWALHCRGMQVCVLHSGHWLMHRQLDADIGHGLADALRRLGIDIITDAHSSAFYGDERGLCGVTLADGQHIPCTLAIINAGILPNCELAADAGLACERGILVDPWLATDDPQIFALGECCQIDELTFGLVEPVYQQAEILARALVGEQGPGYQHRASPTRLKIPGVQVFSAGAYDQSGDCRKLSWRDTAAGDYASLYLQGDTLRAALMLGNCDSSAACLNYIEHQRSLSQPAQLLFGEVPA